MCVCMYTVTGFFSVKVWIRLQICMLCTKPEAGCCCYKIRAKMQPHTYSNQTHSHTHLLTQQHTKTNTFSPHNTHTHTHTNTTPDKGRSWRSETGEAETMGADWEAGVPPQPQVRLFITQGLCSLWWMNAICLTKTGLGCVRVCGSSASSLQREVL